MAIFCARLCSNRLVLWLLVLAGWAMVVLTFIEPPHWCRGGPSSSRWFDDYDYDAQSCTSILAAKGIPATADNSTIAAGELEEVLYFPNSQSMLVTTKQSHIIDACWYVQIGGADMLNVWFAWAAEDLPRTNTFFLVSVAYVLFVTFLRIGRDGLSIKRYFRPAPTCRRRIAQMTCLLLMIAGLATKITVHHPYTRLFILWTMMHAQHRDMQVIIGVLPETFNVLSLLGVIMLFYSWFGTVMFVGTEEGKLYFSSLVESLWTLYICVTTANYPDVMMPAYNGNRWTALYFVSFMVVSFFFLLNIILASVVNEYDEASARRKSEASETANRNLREAYKLMDINGNGRIDRETVMSLFAILNEDFPEFRRLSDEETKLLFAILDQDGSSTITEDEFMNFVSA